MSEHRPARKPAAKPADVRQGMTRREMLVSTAAGALLVAPGVYALVKWRSSPKAVRIVVEGPFPAYGYYFPKDLQMELPEECRVFRPLRVKLASRPRNDEVFVTFGFQGDEDPSRVLAVECRVLGPGGTILAKTERDYPDPRIVAKAMKGKVVFGKPLDLQEESIISVKIPKGKLLSDVERIELYVTEKQAKA